MRSYPQGETGVRDVPRGSIACVVMIMSLRFRVQDYGLRVHVRNYGLRVKGLWFRVQDLGLWVKGSGFRVKGSMIMDQEFF